jgi:multicomponent Na+:H+ antiporter subunit D
MNAALVPLPVALPLLVGAGLAAVNKHIQRALADALAIAVTAVVGLDCAYLISVSAHQPIVYWFGGWFPRGTVAIGIDFAIDPFGAGLATLVCVLMLAAFVFTLHYFDSVGTLFHSLMLSFLAAMCGFSLTGDLFNLFVWFELMSAAAFALCGYKTEEPAPLQGALNFAVTNTVGAFLALSGVAMLYGRTGALNMAQIGHSLGHAHDRLVIIAFVFIMCGFFIKAAVVPFHFWLADAHAVAPTPVCILFSGVMVELGIYAVVRVYWTVFQGSFSPYLGHVRGILIGMGTMTAILGGIMCFAQRHIKRLLAFSTVSHVGLMVIGFGLLTPKGLSGVAAYVLGHGMVKSCLFLAAGILLHRLNSVDELKLHGRGIGMWTTMAIWLLAGLGLAGLPPFGTFLGEAMVDEAAKSVGFDWVKWIFFAAAVLTAGAVFRVAGHVFAGWGPLREAAPTGEGQTDEDQETRGGHQHTPRSMQLPALLLVLIGLALGLVPGLRQTLSIAATAMEDQSGYAARVIEHATVPMPPPEHEEPLDGATERGIAAALAAIAFAAAALARREIKLTPLKRSIIDRLMTPLRLIHSGHVGDYVAWLTFGVVCFGALFEALAR